MKKIIALLLALICLATFAGVMQAKTDLPAAPTGPDRYVQDYANLINPQDRQMMIDLSTAIQEKTKAEIVVVTINSLDGQPMFDYAQNLFRQWGIGDKTKNNGILILVNKENLGSSRPGKVRIHVGYGLEGAMNDAKAGDIMDKYMLPALNSGDYSKGITEGYKAVANVVAGEYNLQLDNSYQPRETQDSRNLSTNVKVPKWAAVLGVILIIILLIIDNTLLGGFFTGMLLGILFSGGFRGGGGGGGWGGGGGFGGGSSGGGGAER